MELIKNIFDEKFDDIIITVKSSDLESTISLMPVRYPSSSENNICINPGSNELTILVKTRYDDQDLYELLCSIKDKLNNVRISFKPICSKERLGVKKEYMNLYNILEKKNEKMLEEYYTAISMLKAIDVDCSRLLPPDNQYLPKECWEWREYTNYQYCGVSINCSKSSELFDFVIDKFKNHNGHNYDHMNFCYNL